MSAIELRYNRLATLRLDFEQEMIYGGRRRIRESGTVFLRRPQKMRWDYAAPKGKLLVGDGERLRMYNPLTNQVRTVHVDETADLRAPLAFLLGRLRFSRQFRKLRLETVDGRETLVGEGRTGKEYYTRVEFGFDPEDYRLSGIKVLGRDGSVTRFRFSNEKRNPPLGDDLFVFRAPEDAEILPERGAGGRL